MGRYFLCKERGTDMAVKLIRGGDPNLPWEYLGLAADAKPTAGVPAGSTFLEADTAVKSMFNGTAWYPIVERTSIVGSLPNQTLIEQLTDADAVVNVLTFSANIEAIEIYHEEATWQTFIVNGLTIIVPAGGYRTPIAGVVGLTVTIPAISCIVGRLV